MTVFNRIQNMLKSKNITAYRMCSDLGIPHTTYSGWKSGRAPSAKSVSEIATYLSTTASYLLGETANPCPPAENGPADNDEANELMREMYERPELRALFKTTKGVKPEDIKYVDDMLKRFKEGYRDD